MIRFLPDTWREALLRPLAMAAPDGNVYVEIMAPDERFVFVALLLLVWLALILKRRSRPAARAPLVLLVVVVLAFVPWLATSGNGRYFIPFLLLVGPLCVALVYWLPWTRAARMALVAGMLLVQGYVTLDVMPWMSWNLGSWREAPYIDLPLPPQHRAVPATYVTITSMSYSLIAPQFHPAAHWVNLSALLEDDQLSVESRRAHELFAASQRLFLVVPSTKFIDEKGQPEPELVDSIDKQIGAHRLGLQRPAVCELVPSKTMARLALGKLENASPTLVAKVGFWICPLRFPVAPPPAQERDTRLDPVFDTIERSCPRFFPPGTAVTAKIANGSLRNYAGADMKLYIFDDGKVYYKYWRALNPVPIASIADVEKPAFAMDCGSIRGRSGLPWERTL
ncbi:MAG: hypothetical protein H7255_19575 [Ramlibacter sp.]|nr:hypothetical protein [Ramlibacter sp.]